MKRLKDYTNEEIKEISICCLSVKIDLYSGDYIVHVFDTIEELKLFLTSFNIIKQEMEPIRGEYFKKCPDFEFKNNKCELPLESIPFLNKDNIQHAGVSEEEFERLVKEMRNQPLQFYKEEVGFQPAIERVIRELKKDDDYYRSWKDSIAMSFKDEYWRTYNKDGFSENELEEIHNIANNAADNFLKLLIK